MIYVPLQMSLGCSDFGSCAQTRPSQRIELYGVRMKSNDRTEMRFRATKVRADFLTARFVRRAAHQRGPLHNSNC